MKLRSSDGDGGTRAAYRLSEGWYRALSLAVLFLAAMLRFVAPDWDGGIAAHPDERFLVGAAQTVPLYANVCAAIPDFPYGHLPVTLARLVILTAPGADPLYALRLCSALVGVVLVALAGACGRRLAGRAGGLLAAGAAAWAPFLIQEGHFYTVDPLASALACAAGLAIGRRRWWAGGALAGLAVACKASLAVVAVPFAIFGIWVEPATPDIRQAGRRLGAMATGALLAFAAVSPWSLLAPVACWRGPWVQSLMASGRVEFPYTLQYANTRPYLYPLAQMSLWGLGPGVTLLGLVGLARAILTGDARRRPSVRIGWLLALVYLLGFGGLHVKFARYMLPLYPWWAGLAAYAALPGLANKHARPDRAPAQVSSQPARRIVRAGVLAIAWIPTVLLGIAQTSLYRTPHPWETASRWLYANVEPGDTIAVETWDHPLPALLPGQDPIAFQQVELPVLAVESPEKLAALEDADRRAAFVVLASRRGYGGISTRPEEYAATLTWYRNLLSTREARVFARCPSIGPLAVTDDPVADAGLSLGVSLAERCGASYALRLPRLDENFRVYDAPTVIVLSE